VAEVQASGSKQTQQILFHVCRLLKKKVSTLKTEDRSYPKAIFTLSNFRTCFVSIILVTQSLQFLLFFFFFGGTPSITLVNRRESLQGDS
jgi:hypothetical protein